LHELPGWQPWFGVQELQLPLLQTLLVPHEVPFPLLVVSAQTDAPLEHEVAPFLQGFDGWQPTPALQALQVPLLQTLSAPQAVPLFRFLAVSEQLMEGEQTVAPV
jgi:hypothetical protein